MKYILNEVDSYQELTNSASKRTDYRPQAYCTSFTCCGDRYTKMGVKRDVPKSTIDCPICKSALFWCDERYILKIESLRDNFTKNKTQKI